MRIDFHARFDKQYKKLSSKERQQFKAKLAIFIQNNLDPVLNNHSLKGRFADYRSINVNGDTRAIFMQHTSKHVEFVYIGTHNQLYR